MIKAAKPSGLNNRRLGRLIRKMATSVEGELGAWRFEANGILMFCISDEDYDRMRIFAPIANVAELNEDILRECLLSEF